jgi:hypothetical protein
MDHHPSSHPTEFSDVDLAATRRRFLVAREQSAAHSSMPHIRSTMRRSWTEHHRSGPADR